MKKVLITSMLLLSVFHLYAQEMLTLETCRQRALDANKGMKQAQERVVETENLQRAALWQMLPKVDATGGYMWMDRSVNLLSEEQKGRLTHLGDNIESDIQAALREELSGIPILGTQLADALSGVLSGSSLTNRLNNTGCDIADALETDTRNTAFGVVTLSQPLYLGGKLRALYQSARIANQLSHLQFDKKRDETLIAVDEAYWQVVSVKQKKRLAERYATLLDTLLHNVDQLVEAEMATQGDLAKVRVKYNEAQMTLTKATNGLALAKMLLAQRCGMPLDAQFDVAELSPLSTTPHTSDTVVDMEQVWQQRKELQMLRLSDSLAQQGVRMAASSLKPNIALTGGYLFSTPNLFDGFKNELGGTWMAGVVVNIPILHPGGIYSVKAAKAKRREVAYQIEEAQEMIALQVNKLNYELQLAHKKREQATSNLEQAEENLRLADESFKAGLCSSSDLMAAQTAWIQAHNEVLDAEIEIEMDACYLRQALGK